jgi:hypothetical protein
VPGYKSSCPQRAGLSSLRRSYGAVADELLPKLSFAADQERTQDEHLFMQRTTRSSPLPSILIDYFRRGSKEPTLFARGHAPRSKPPARPRRWSTSAAPSARGRFSRAKFSSGRDTARYGGWDIRDHWSQRQQSGTEDVTRDNHPKRGVVQALLQTRTEPNH